MSYRLPEEWDPRTVINDTAIQSVIRVDNGTISRITIPCVYDYAHMASRLLLMTQDHLGWPSPDSADRSMQPYDGIDLTDEGYDSVIITFLDPPDGLSAEGEIDIDLIRVTFDVSCASAEDEDVDVTFAINVVGDGLNDLVTKGTLHIVAGPIPNQP